MSFTVLATTSIHAPPEVVWKVLTDVADWPLWSSYLVYEGGTLAQGQTLHLRLTLPGGGGYAFSPEVLVWEPPHHFAWVGRTGIAGVFDGEHHFEITPREGGCVLVNRERYSGLLSPLMQRLPDMKNAPAGFEAMNAELKARAEALVRLAP